MNKLMLYQVERALYHSDDGNPSLYMAPLVARLSLSCPDASRGDGATPFPTNGKKKTSCGCAERIASVVEFNCTDLSPSPGPKMVGAVCPLLRHVRKSLSIASDRCCKSILQRLPFVRRAKRESTEAP